MSGKFYDTLKYIREDDNRVESSYEPKPSTKSSSTRPSKSLPKNASTTQHPNPSHPSRQKTMTPPEPPSQPQHRTSSNASQSDTKKDADILYNVVHSYPHNKIVIGMLDEDEAQIMSEKLRNNEIKIDMNDSTKQLLLDIKDGENTPEVKQILKSTLGAGAEELKIYNLWQRDIFKNPSRIKKSYGYAQVNADYDLLIADMSALMNTGTTDKEAKAMGLKIYNERVKENDNKKIDHITVHLRTKPKERTTAYVRGQNKDAVADTVDNVIWIEEEGKTYVYTSKGIPINIDDLASKWNFEQGKKNYVQLDGRNENLRWKKGATFDWVKQRWNDDGKWSDLANINNREFLLGDFDNDGIKNIDDARPN